MPKNKKKKEAVEQKKEEAVKTNQEVSSPTEANRKKTKQEREQERNNLKLERKRLKKELDSARREERRLKRDLRSFLSQDQSCYHEGNTTKASVHTPSVTGGSDDCPTAGGSSGDGRATRRSPRIVKHQATNLFR